MNKNVASQKLIVYVYDSTTNLPKTGDAANLTAYVSKDYGSVTVLGDTSATEMDATNGKGYYLFDLTQAETNADVLLFSCKSTTANMVPLGMPAVVYTVPANFTKLVIDASGLADANAVKVGPTGAGTAQTARDIGLSVLLSSGTGTGQLSITSGIASVNTTQLAGQTVTAAAGVTFPSSVASPTNITAGVITTVTTVTNQLTAAAIATGIWQDTTAGDFTTALSVGKSVMNGVALGTGLTVANLTNAPTAGDFTATMKTSVGTAVAASAVASVTGNVGGNVTGSVGSVVGAVGSVTGAVGSVTGAVGSVTGAVGSVTAGCSLTSGERNSVADALLDRTAGVETNFTPRQSLRLMLSALAAKLSGAATTTVVIRDVNDTKARITATVDTNGNRSAVTTDVT